MYRYVTARPHACRSTFIFYGVSSLACRFEAFEPRAALRRSESLRRRASRPAAGPPTHAIAGARARALTMATVRPPKHLNSKGCCSQRRKISPGLRGAPVDEAGVLLL